MVEQWTSSNNAGLLVNLIFNATLLILNRTDCRPDLDFNLYFEDEEKKLVIDRVEIARKEKENGKTDEILVSVAQHCSSLMIANTKRFYPVTYHQRWRFTKDWRDQCEFLGKMTEESIAVHWWNSGIEVDKMNSNSTLIKIMEVQCPAFSNTFGFTKLLNRGKSRLEKTGYGKILSK